LLTFEGFRQKKFPDVESTTTPFTIGSDEESQPTRASKRRRTNTGSEEQHSDGNFQKISKNLIKIFYNI
jgi:hypothetical protein